MKTTSYIAANEISTGIILIVITIAIFTALKVKEIQSKEMKIKESAGTCKILSDNPGFSSLPIFDTKLTGSTGKETKTTGDTESFGTTAAEIKEFEAATEKRLELMTNVKYNANDFVEAQIELEIEKRANESQN
jgi:hypothetical protein